MIRRTPVSPVMRGRLRKNANLTSSFAQFPRGSMLNMDAAGGARPAELVGPDALADCCIVLLTVCYR
jgi:hypothetical protein